MNSFGSCIADNLVRVNQRIAAALQRSGRSGQDVRLIVVSKTQDAERVREAVAAGATDLGENYVQEAEEKYSRLGPIARWHFIGHLQKNKARHAVRMFDMIQSVDSLELAQEIGRRAAAAGRTIDILLEVNVAAEATKFGLNADGALALADEIYAVEGIRMCGLMGMAPFVADPEEVRPVFRQLKGLWDKLPKEQRQFLSMGMTGDFEIAIEEGSNMVRIGTAIFGPRNA